MRTIVFPIGSRGELGCNKVLQPFASSIRPHSLSIVPFTMLALVSLALASSPAPSALSNSKVLALRGGMSFGPLNSGNFEGSLKVAAAVTAAGAITSKYANIEETTLTKTFSGGAWNTNLIISVVTGVTSTVVYSVGASAFDSAQLTAVLWLASVLLDLKGADFKLNSLMDDKVQTAVAACAAVLTFA